MLNVSPGSCSEFECFPIVPILPFIRCHKLLEQNVGFLFDGRPLRTIVRGFCNSKSTERNMFVSKVFRVCLCVNPKSVSVAYLSVLLSGPAD